jgi:ectoine hydroxylase-related dioxygenase (phytanoyl-CoA dioxygenase family)
MDDYLRAVEAGGFAVVPGAVPADVADRLAALVGRMLAIRVHLDDCGPDNGPLRMIPGSQRGGVLDSSQIDGWRNRGPEVACPVGRGGLVVLRPLVLHASSPAGRPSRRRVLHIEYAAPDLPGGLEWFEAVGRDR